MRDLESARGGQDNRPPKTRWWLVLILAAVGLVALAKALAL